MFAIYFPKEKAYARFGSYSTVTLVDLPEEASLYSREKDAKDRAVKCRVSGMWKNRASWRSPLVLHEIAFSHQITRTF